MKTLQEAFDSLDSSMAAKYKSLIREVLENKDIKAQLDGIVIVGCLASPELATQLAFCKGLIVGIEMEKTELPK